MNKKLCVAVAASFLTLLTMPALADQTTDYQAGNDESGGVMDRARPEYDAKGLPLGAFRLFPTIDVAYGYDDNVLRQNTNTKASSFFHETGGFKLDSNWSRHMLEVYASVDSFQYSSLSSENHTNWIVGANSRLDIVRGSDLTLDGFYGDFHESRGSPDLLGFAKEPTKYSQGHVDGAVEYHPYRFGFTLGGSVDTFNYDNTPKIGGGTIDNNDRDRTVYNVFGKATYEFQPGTAIFARATYNNRNFDQTFDRNGLRRDSNGENYDAGLDLMLTHLIHGEVFVGYLKQNYIAPLHDVSGFDFGATVDWYVTQLFTVHFNASRLLNDTTINNASASDDRNVGASFDWEVMRNIIVQGNVGYTDSRFNGSGRDDKFTTAGAGLKYLINRYLSANATYQFQQRNSNIAGQDYNDSTVMVGLTLHP